MLPEKSDKLLTKLFSIAISGADIIPRNSSTAPIETTSAKEVTTINNNNDKKCIFLRLEKLFHKRLY